MMRVKRLMALLLALLLPALCAAEEARVVYGSVAVCADATEVDLGPQQVNDWPGFYAFLEALPQVRQVDMYATVVTRREIERLTERFPQITFGWTIHIAQEHYVRTDQTAFSTLHGRCTNHTSEELDVLRYCTELRALDLGHNHIRDLSFLEGLTELRVLILACNPQLRDLSPIAGLRKLEYLEVFSCNVADLTPLEGLEHLQHLNVAYNPIRRWDAILTLPHLKRLWISQTGIPVRGGGLQELQQALPGTTIAGFGHPTANGWREGPHHATIQSMFRAGEYVPFEDSFPDE